jgi:hypothetical protein
MNWRTAFGELIIVVVGVIIALTVDSWWDEKQDRVLEREHLAALFAETETNLLELRATISRLDTLRESTVTLIEIVEGVRPEPPADSMVELTWLAFSYATYDPVSTAYDDLVSSGGIRLLQDIELKRELAFFKSQVEALPKNDWMLDQWNRIIQPWAIRNLQLDWLLPDYRDRYGIIDPVALTDWGAVLEDPEFKGIVINKHLAITDYSYVFDDIYPILEALVVRLSESLGDEEEAT